MDPTEHYYLVYDCSQLEHSAPFSSTTVLIRKPVGNGLSMLFRAGRKIFAKLHNFVWSKLQRFSDNRWRFRNLSCTKIFSLRSSIEEHLRKNVKKFMSV